MWKSFCADEFGTVVSIEIILIITIAVLALIVGWSEVAHAINTELDDISNAVGKFSQSYQYSGFGSFKTININNGNNIKAIYWGSAFFDTPDECDGFCSGTSQITCCAVVAGVNAAAG